MRNNATHQEKLEYFISNIENYPIDPEGNFFNIDPENFGTDYYYIGRGIFSPKDYEKIDKSLTNKILENKED